MHFDRQTRRKLVITIIQSGSDRTLLNERKCSITGRARQSMLTPGRCLSRVLAENANHHGGTRLRSEGNAHLLVRVGSPRAGYRGPAAEMRNSLLATVVGTAVVGFGGSAAAQWQTDCEFKVPPGTTSRTIQQKSGPPLSEEQHSQIKAAIARERPASGQARAPLLRLHRDPGSAERALCRAA